MNEMWEALERYQPYAEQHGFGAEWLKMTTERTEEAAWEARARASQQASGQAAWLAWWAVGVTATSRKAAFATEAIKNIDYAIAEENK